MSAMLTTRSTSTSMLNVIPCKRDASQKLACVDNASQAVVIAYRMGCQFIWDEVTKLENDQTTTIKPLFQVF